MYVTSRTAPASTAADAGLIRTYRPGKDIVGMVRQILTDFGFDCPWQDMERDIGNILRSLPEERPEVQAVDQLTVEVIGNLFFRNKGALAVGRLIVKGSAWPIALPLLLDDEQHVYVDTLICDADELSVLFSFTRAYFMVRLPHPIALVNYLSDMLPNKKRSELFASVGLHKQGKTELYRGFLEHLARSDDKFIIAPGIKGMVMAVFTLPSYQTVFKVIKDRFAPQKDITEAEVAGKIHDRQTPRSRGPDGRHAGVQAVRVSPAPFLRGPDRRANGGGPIESDHSRRRHRDLPRLHGTVDDATEPLHQRCQRRRPDRSPRRVRQRNQATGCRQHFPPAICCSKTSG